MNDVHYWTAQGILDLCETFQWVLIGDMRTAARFHYQAGENLNRAALYAELYDMACPECGWLSDHERVSQCRAHT